MQQNLPHNAPKCLDGNSALRPLAPTAGQQVQLRPARLALDTAVQWFESFGTTPLQADEFASVVSNLASQARDALPATIDNMQQIATQLHAQGNLPAAEAVLTALLDKLRQTLGAQDAHTLRAQNSLACLQQHQGKWLAARRLYLHTLEQQRHKFGLLHVDTIATMENLGTLLYEQEEIDLALPLMQETVVFRRRTLGDAHHETLRAFNNLALVLQKQGKLQDAETLLQQALLGQTALLGAEHPETLTSEANLATVLEDQGKMTAAEQHHRHCLALRTQVLPPQHVATLTSANNLAAFLMTQNHLEEACSLLQQTLEQAQRVLPADDFFCANLQARYGTCLFLKRDYDDAEKWLTRGYEHLKASLGAMHQRTQRVCSTLIQLYQLWGKPQQVAMYRAALQS